MDLQKIDTLIEQTSYLHDKQKELLKISEDSFCQLLNIVEQDLKQAQQSQDSEKIKNLKAIEDYIIKYKEKSEGKIVEDIDFLREQLEAITKIKMMKDRTKAQELLDMIISDEDGLLPTEEFKKQVEQDIYACKKEMDLMLEDLKNAVKEGDLQELKLLLEATTLADDDLQDEDEQELNFENNDKSPCSSCDSKCQDESSCAGGHDIFSAFADLNKKDDK
ncbi:hypothetical protein GF322_01895 [Candidatus Dependentiae bacterium]|nr:hypothetical protein [Candidatus Dependentiae bacterium]